MTEPIPVVIANGDLRRLVSGRTVGRTIAGQRVEIHIDQAITLREILLAVAAALGRDPMIAGELPSARPKK